MSLDLFQNLLGTNVSEIEDLPDYITPPRGTMLLACDKAEIGTNQEQTEGKIKMTFSFKEMIETTKTPNASDEVDADGNIVIPAEGSLITFSWTGEKGLKRFKKTFLHCFESTGITNIQEFLDQADQLDFVCLVSRNVSSELFDDDGEPRVFANLRAATVA